MTLAITLKPGLSITTHRPALLLPRIVNGCDYGTERKLLMQLGPSRPGIKRLIWQPGAKHWRNLMVGYVYSPGSLAVHRIGQVASDRWLDTEPSGVTKLDRLLKLPTTLAWIREHFVNDDDLISRIHPRTSVIVRGWTT